MKNCPYCAEEIQDAAVVCRHCGRDLRTGAVAGAPQAPAAPQVVVKPKEGCFLQTMNVGCVIVLVLLLLPLGFCGLAFILGSFRTATTGGSTPASKPAPLASGAAKPAPTPSPYGKWSVSTTVSKVDDTKTVVLQLEANNSINGWLKNSTPTLVVRCKERKTEAYIITGMPPAVEYGETDRATVLLRFDKDKPVQYMANESTDKEALFLPNALTLARTMAKHDQMLFRFTPFNASPQEATFTLTGFDKAVTEVQAACGWK